MLTRLGFWVALWTLWVPEAWSGTDVEVLREPLTQMSFVQIPKGCFQMGTAIPVTVGLNQSWRWYDYRQHLSEDEIPQHEVCLDAFAIGAYEVRADEWRRIMGSSPPEGVGDRPASGIDWQQARLFGERLSNRSTGGYRFRLPTEAEWEYVCRAGDTDDPFEHNRLLAKVAWFDRPRTQHAKSFSVGLLQANAWGVYDMRGNVWEWVADGYDTAAYASHELYNPLNREGVGRVIRGGSYRTSNRHVRCASRGDYPENQSLKQLGFRLVAVPR